MRPFSFFSLSPSLLLPRPSFLLVSPSSSSLLPPRPSFFLLSPGDRDVAERDEEGGTWRKGRGGRRDGESEKNEKVVGKMKN